MISTRKKHQNKNFISHFADYFVISRQTSKQQNANQALIAPKLHDKQEQQFVGFSLFTSHAGACTPCTS